MPEEISRKSFIQVSAMTGASIALSSNIFFREYPGEDINKSLVFLFQGDSITDGNRGRNEDPNHIMGHGYAFSIASRVGADFAENRHVFYNRGVSGNRVDDLKNRWQTDALDLNADVLSILVGINDASLLVAKNMVDVSEIDQFEENYRQILLQSKQQNPAILFVLCLPFVFPVGQVKDKWENYKKIVKELQTRVYKLAKEFDAILVDCAPVFAGAEKKAPIDYWIWDGIHPTVPGHELIAREWIKQVGTRLAFLKKYGYH